MLQSIYSIHVWRIEILFDAVVEKRQSVVVLLKVGVGLVGC